MSPSLGARGALPISHFGGLCLPDLHMSGGKIGGGRLPGHSRLPPHRPKRNAFETRQVPPAACIESTSNPTKLASPDSFSPRRWGFASGPAAQPPRVSRRAHATRARLVGGPGGPPPATTHSHIHTCVCVVFARLRAARGGICGATRAAAVGGVSRAERTHCRSVALFDFEGTARAHRATRESPCPEIGEKANAATHLPKRHRARREVNMTICAMMLDNGQEVTGRFPRHGPATRFNEAGPCGPARASAE